MRRDAGRRRHTETAFGAHFFSGLLWRRRHEVGWDKLQRSPTKKSRKIWWDRASLVPPYAFRGAFAFLRS